MTARRSDRLKRALTLWKQVTGVNPDGRSQTLGNWDIARTFESVQEAITLDPTEITATLLLTHFVNAYVAETEVPISQVLRNDPKLSERIDACRELYTLIERPEIVEIREAFVAAVASALKHYKADHRDDVQELLASPDRIAILRRDALRSIKNLKVDQFLDGEPSPASDRIVYNDSVHQWWNVNSLLAASARMPPGIALNLIRTPDEFQCFFCFSIRNGANLFVLSDVPEYSHPLQGQMSRRPDRELGARAARNWFPYDLLGLAYDEEEGRLYFKQAEGTAITPYQKDALPLRKISDLPANEIVWLVMMFDLIKERFWRAGYRAKELSYTAEMLKTDHALLDVAKTANLPVAKYAPIRLAPLAIADVAVEALPKEAVGSLGHQTNRWMEERYIGRIDPETINLVAPPEIAYAVVADGTINRKVVRGRDDGFDDGYYAFDRREPAVRLEKVSSSTFGTRKSLSDDRLFIARYNLASQIDRMAKREYEERKKEIAEWYRSRIEANAANLVAWAANDAMWVCDGKGVSFSGWHSNVGPARYVETEDGRTMYRSLVKHFDVTKDPYASSAGFFLPAYDGRTRQLCWFHKVKASFHLTLCPGKPRELALFAGCTVDELPDVLRHFDLHRPYSGNSILDRIDPMEWHAQNPWIKMDFRIRIALSKRGMAEALRVKKMPDIPGLSTSVPEGIPRGRTLTL